MAQIGARGSASVYALNGGNNADDPNSFSKSNAAGWHMGWWGASVLIIAFFLWAL